VHDPLAVYIPDYPGGDKITLHHLMTHTSGIPNVNAFPNYDAKSKFPHITSDLVALFKDRPTMFEPGERYSYSNSNYNLLAYIIEHVSGMSYGEFLQKNVFSPLNMENTAHHGHAGTLIMNRASGYVPVGVDCLENAPFIDWSIKTGNGSLYSTVDNLYTFDRALYTQKLLKKASLEQAFTEHIEGIGYGWFIGKRHGRNVIRINGRSPGFGSAFQRYVDDDVCIVVLSNNYAATASAIADAVAAIVFGEPYEIPDIVEPVSLSPEQMERFAGWYQFGDMFYVPNARYRIESRGDYLVMRLGDWSTSMFPLSDTTFFIREFWARVSFVKNAEGEVSHLFWGDFKARKVGGD
jgi:CubicO group peptidase (beta-lactamase class C family)